MKGQKSIIQTLTNRSFKANKTRNLDAIDAVLSHYAGYIRYFSKVHGQVNAEVEELPRCSSFDLTDKQRTNTDCH